MIAAFLFESHAASDGAQYTAASPVGTRNLWHPVTAGGGGGGGDGAAAGAVATDTGAGNADTVGGNADDGVTLLSK